MKEEKKNQLDGAIEAQKQLVADRIQNGAEIKYSETRVAAYVKSEPKVCQIETLEKIDLKKNDPIEIIDSGETVYFQNCRPNRSFQCIVSYRTQATYEKLEG